MKKRFLILFAVLSVAIWLPIYAINIPSTHLVSPTWLAKNMHNKSLVIVDTRRANEYNAGHIPGAISIPVNSMRENRNGIPSYAASPEKITKLFRQKGISNNSYIVFYSGNGRATSYAASTREFWTAWYYGLSNLAVLRGGFNRWKAEKRVVSKVPVTLKQGNFTIKKMRLNTIATLPYVDYAAATKKVQLLDSREPAHFYGKDNDPRLAKHGHISGAKELFVGDFSKKVGSYYEIGSKSYIKTIFKKAGFNLNKPIITYCNTGHLGSGSWFVIRFVLNNSHTALYDGSMVEYSKMPNRSVIK